MRLNVVIVDPRTIRVANLNKRVASFVQQVLADKTKFAKLTYRLVQYSGINDWHVDVKTATSADVLSLVLVHHTNADVRIIKELSDHAAQGGDAVQRCLAAVYSGDDIDDDEALRLETFSRPDHGLTVLVCRDLVPGDLEDEDGAWSGMRQPPVEAYLAQLLDLPESMAVAPAWPDPSRPASGGATLKHELINLTGPIAFALGRRLSLLERQERLDDGCEAICMEAVRSLVDLGERIPPWIIESARTIEGLVKQLRDKVYVKAALRVVGDIEGFAKASTGEVIDWAAIATLSKDYAAGQVVNLLWVDDHKPWCEAFKPVLEDCGFKVTYREDVNELVNNPGMVTDYDAVLLDIVLNGCGGKVAEALRNRDLATDEPFRDTTASPDRVDSVAGVGLLQLLRSEPGCPPVFIFTARESVDVVRACTFLNASDYFVKGRHSVLNIVTSVLREVTIKREQNAVLSPKNDVLFVAGKDDPLSDTLRDLDKFARAACSGSRLTLVGEPGTGKGELAKEYHLRSPRKKGPFVHINCANFSETLVEAELFGWVKGAHSTATSDRESRFEEAKGGVIFIDEVHELPVHLQARLLGVMNDRVISRVGNNTATMIDVAFIIGTIQTPQALIEEMRLHLGVGTRMGSRIRVPSLRERADVVPDLARMLADRHWKLNDRKGPAWAEDTRTWLRIQAAGGAFWGNFRTLEDLITTVFALTQDHDGPTAIDRALLQDCLERYCNSPEARDLIREIADIYLRHVTSGQPARLPDVMSKAKDLIRERLFSDPNLNYKETADLLGQTPGSLKTERSKLKTKKEAKRD